MPPIPPKRKKPPFCAYPGCGREVPTGIWGCIDHWSILPDTIRNIMTSEFKAGQGVIQPPTQAYLEAAARAEDWIHEHRKCVACEGTGESTSGRQCHPCKGSGVKQ